jgi:hypothetical protein
MHPLVKGKYEMYLSRCLKARHGRRTVDQDHEIAQSVLGPRVHEVAHRVVDAVREGFAADHDLVGMLEHVHESLVETATKSS